MLRFSVGALKGWQINMANKLNFRVDNTKDNKISWYSTSGEAYLAMIQWVRDNWGEKDSALKAVEYIRGISDGFNAYNEYKEGDWFGIAGVITCERVEDNSITTPVKVDAPAQVISKDKFIKWVKEIKKIRDNYDMFLDQVYEIFGSSAQDTICNAMNEGYLIEMLADFIGDKNQTLSYYFYELDCDFSEFDKNVKLEGAPSVKDYGDLYDFIMYENGITDTSDDDDSDWDDNDSGWEDYD